MFLEQEVYELLSWGFSSVMVTQFIFVVGLWMSRKFDIRSFVYLISYLILFSFGGYNLLVSINTMEHHTSMDSENASINVGLAGLFWAFSILFLLLAIYRLVKAKE